MRPSSVLAVCTAAALAFSAVAQSLETPVEPVRITDLNIPQIGEPADAALSPAEEERIGADIVGQMYFYEYVLEDPQLTEYVSSLGWKLAAASAGKPPQLDVFVVKDPRINAFALPGGHIGMNAGLITASGSESELAGVMAHELVHVTQRHSARGASKGGGWESIAMMGAMLAAMIAGSADPDLVMGTLAIGQSAMYQRQVNYTRAHELEADRLGIQTLAAAGFDPQGMAAFFQRLEQQSRLYGGGVPEILRTHPVNTTRIAEARSRAANMPAVERADSLDYRLMRARARVLMAERPSQAVEYFDAQLRAGNDALGSGYGLALALAQIGQFERAEEHLKPLLAQYPRQPHLNLLEGSLQMSRRRTDDALATYRRTLETFPRFAPAVLAYADALITAGRPAEARTLLIEREQAYGTQIDTHRLLAQAALALGNDAEASYQMANYLALHGDPGGALAQLDAGLRLASIAPQDRAKLAARRQELREALPRDYDPYREGSR